LSAATPPEPRHHKHTNFLVQNVDIPGLADRQHELVAPETTHPLMDGLSHTEAHLVRKMSTRELWDAEREAPLFRRIFGKRLQVASTRN
jgi:hypothetical protein